MVWLATEVDPGKVNSKYVLILPPFQSACSKVLVGHRHITGNFSRKKLNSCFVSLVFSVTPFKIDRNKTDSNRSIDKVQNLGKYAKPLAGIQVTTICLKRDMRRNVLPRSKETCMETPCWSSSGWAPTWRPETNRTSVFSD